MFSDRRTYWVRTLSQIAVVAVLIVHSDLTASTISWNGGAGNYSNAGNWTCASCPSATFPNNGNLGLTFDATINSGLADSVLLDITGVVVNSMSIGGSGPTAPSTLNVNGKSLTLGTPSVTSGNVLTISNGGTFSVGSGSATLELSGGASALNDVGGQISVADGGKLILQNLNMGGAATLVNNGNISVTGVSTPASLILNGASGSSFTLSGTGALTLSGKGQIAEQTGAESLINDVSHTIAGDGLISGLTSITNNGTLHATTSGAALIAGSSLTNWDTTTNTLTGGSYVVENGSTLQLSSIGAGNTIQNLNSAAVTVNGTGVLTGGGGTNALTGLANINQSSLTLNGGNLALGQALTVSAIAPPSDNAAAQLQLNSSTLTIAGDLTNSASSPNGNNTVSTVALGGGSSLTVNNLSNNAINGGVSGNTSAIVNLTGGSSLAVTGDVNNSATGFPTCCGQQTTSAINLDGGSSLTVAGAFTNAAAPSFFALGPISASLTLTNNSTASVTGLYDNNNGTITLQGGSSLTVGQSLSNFSFATGADFGASLLELDSSSTAVVVGNLNNTAQGTGDDTSAFSTVSLNGGSSLTVDNLINTAISGFNESGGPPLGTGVASVALTGGSSLAVNGNVTNTGPEGDGHAGISLDGGSSLNVAGTFFSQGTFQGAFIAGLNLTNNSTATVTGLFTNQIGSLVSLDTASTLITKGGFSNSDAVTLNLNSTLANTGTFSNSGSIDLSNGSKLTTSGLFDNTGGTLTLHGGGNSVTAGSFNNPGSVILGDNDTITVTGQFQNSGVIAFTGTNGIVSSGGDFTNAASGMMTVDGTGNAFSTMGNLMNAGTIEISGGGSVTVAGSYTQTAGTTAANTGGTLTAGTIDLQGGTLTGGGTINGDLTVDGGTLNPGDPQSITINGNYDQTLLGILDVDLASATSYDHVTVNGHATLGGTLDLTIETGFSASIGTTFNIFSWLSETGDFATFNDPTFNNGTETFREVFSGNQLDLLVVSTTAPPVAEPSTLGMLACGLFLLVVGVKARQRYWRSTSAR
ncbi:MAG TPA: hypothetical protein VKB79_21710 [Bryobacteraceae bacterium]|nr:hypothetical protein [Bryobacteraceae bacterium]